jgi:hypothetical protein
LSRWQSSPTFMAAHLFHEGESKPTSGFRQDRKRHIEDPTAGRAEALSASRVLRRDKLATRVLLDTLVAERSDTWFLGHGRKIHPRFASCNSIVSMRLRTVMVVESYLVAVNYIDAIGPEI